MSPLHCKGATSCFFNKHFWLRPKAAPRRQGSSRHPNRERAYFLGIVSPCGVWIPASSENTVSRASCPRFEGGTPSTQFGEAPGEHLRPLQVDRRSMTGCAGMTESWWTGAMVGCHGYACVAMRFTTPEHAYASVSMAPAIFPFFGWAKAHAGRPGMTGSLRAGVPRGGGRMCAVWRLLCQRL